VPYEEPTDRRRWAVGIYRASFSGGMASDDSACYSRFSAVLASTYSVSEYYRTQYINVRDKNKVNRSDSSKNKGFYFHSKLFVLIRILKLYPATIILFINVPRSALPRCYPSPPLLLAYDKDEGQPIRPPLRLDPI